MMTAGFRLFAFVIVAAIVSLSALAGSARAQTPIPEELKSSCAKELKEYCRHVTPGEGRVAACLYSYNDKISAQCAFAMVDATEQYEHIMAALRHIVKRTACRSDIAAYCQSVPPGGGRIFACIQKNKATLTDGCRKALPHAEALLKQAGIIQ